MQPSEIKARARALGLDQKGLAHLAGLHKTTIERTFNKKSRPLHDTVERLLAAIEREEKRRRDHLIDLHGLPDRPAFKINGTLRRIVTPTIEPEKLS